MSRCFPRYQAMGWRGSRLQSVSFAGRMMAARQLESRPPKYSCKVCNERREEAGDGRALLLTWRSCHSVE